MPLAIQRIDARREDVTPALDALRERLSPRGNVVSEASRQRTIDVFGAPLSPAQVVEKICGDVRSEGLAAVLRYAKLLDKAELTSQTIRVSAAELETAHRQAEPEFLASIRRIRENILEFQRAILLRDVEVRRPSGVVLRQRYLPLARVGLCVPGGAAAYPSTVLMTAVPAMAAGVQELVVIAPPTKYGANNPDVLATCHELGICEVYRVGGATGVAALAYGVGGTSIPTRSASEDKSRMDLRSVHGNAIVVGPEVQPTSERKRTNLVGPEVQPTLIRRVDKIVGPGNMFVALAKRHVFGEVDIDSIAGPSEVVVIADETTRPDFAAADMLAQAEHAPGASILVTWSEKALDETLAELEQQIKLLDRSEVTVQSLESYGALILVANEDEACRITDLLAPEHLHIATENAERLLAKIRNAGATFLGNYSPVALGDYVAGPSHVLPTGGTARWASGLTANDFLRGGSVIAYSDEGLRQVAEDVRRLAEKEGLTAHRESVEVRIKDEGGGMKDEK